MKVLIVTDKFKGSLSSMEAAMAIKAGFEKAGRNFQCTCLPVSDGGDGLKEAVKMYTEAEEQVVQVHDPLFRPIKGSFLVAENGRTAFIEMATASGLALLRPAEQNCMNTSTFGTGELIRSAINTGAETIVLGIGGSATNDGGMGMAAALRFRFLDSNGKELPPVGASLIHVATIDGTHAPDLANLRFKVACDVSNPLAGPQGAARIYAPQKGASPEMVQQLEEGMLHFAAIIKKDLGVEVLSLKGGGAAGGMGAGCVAFLNATLVPGMQLFLDLSKMDKHIEETDLVVTGEGKIDEQSLHGKVVAALAQRAFDYHKRAIAFCGSLDLSPHALNALHLDAVYSLKAEGVSEAACITHAGRFLTERAYQAAMDLQTQTGC